MTSLSRLAFRLLSNREGCHQPLRHSSRAIMRELCERVEAGRRVPKVLWCPLCLPPANQKATEKCEPAAKEEGLKSEREEKKSPFSKGVDPCNCFQTQLSRGILLGHLLSQDSHLPRPTNYRLPYPLNRIANYCRIIALLWEKIVDIRSKKSF